MKVIRYLLLTNLFMPCWVLLAEPQQRPSGVNARGIVETAELSGIDEDDLSDDLRKSVHGLQGKTFDQQAAVAAGP